MILARIYGLPDKKQDVHSVQSVRPVNRYVKRSVYQGEIDEHSDYEH